MKFTACLGRKEIETFDPPYPDTCLVSIRDPGSEIPHHPSKYYAVIYLAFWDAEQGNPVNVYDQMVGDYVKQPPAPLEDLELLYAFLKANWTRSIIAHCEAGRSRSAAVREFLVRRNWVLGLRGQQNRQVFPNTHVLATLERLDKGSDYEKTIEKQLAIVETKGMTPSEADKYIQEQIEEARARGRILGYVPKHLPPEDIQ